MLGAIVGDLAAWTYENDKERFYSSLTSKDALLSPFGKIAYETAIWNLDREEGERITLSPDVHWGPLTHAENLIRCATLAWTSDMPFNLFDSSHGPFYDDKEGWYAGNIIVELIDSLHHGKTKKEVLMTPSYWCNAFQELKSYWKWQIVEPEQGLLIYLMRAWNCFEKAWDFTSAIHNAARWQKVDRHLLCSITGALAESMYGCEFNFLKKKYGDSCEIAYPEVMAKDARRIHEYQFRNRFFFPKNSARTNVEKQSWTVFPNRFEGKMLTAERAEKILRAFDTGWDDRYGFYLDDGWIYVYRSYVLIARFHLIKKGDSYTFVNVQRSQEKPECAELAIEEALCSSAHLA